MDEDNYGATTAWPYPTYIKKDSGISYGGFYICDYCHSPVENSKICTCKCIKTPSTIKANPVKHPNHYGGEENIYEAIKVIHAWALSFNLGNTIKYICRAGKKDRTTYLEDLKKARFYIDWEIKRKEEEKRIG